jgi:hypothetical protein
MAVLIRLWHGDCLARLKEMDDGSVDAFVGDPPYDIAFMSREWDDNDTLRNDKIWRECLRVLVLGGIIKQFSATRTYHRLCKTFEFVGFDQPRLEAWIYGSGFPKSTNISKMIDKQAGAEREVVGYKRGVGGENMNDIVRGTDVRQTTDEGGKGVGAYGTGAKQVAVDVPITIPMTEMAKLWDGYGTALKPAWEPVVVARKPT